MTKIAATAGILFSLILLSMVARDAVRATTLAPIYSVTLSSSTPGANASVTFDYQVDPPDSMESEHVTFIPSAFGVAADADVPDGARVGTMLTLQTESISNGPCGMGAGSTFDLLDATTNTGNLLADSPRIPDAGWPGFADADLNNLPDAIDKYPNFLAVLYPGLTPRARAYGSAMGTTNRVVNVLVFDPGTPLPGMSPIDPSLGYEVVVVIQDPTAPPLPSSSITDSCTPIQLIWQDRAVTGDNPLTGANEAGFVYRTNPAADGAYTFMEYGRTIRDLDSDDIENTLDACPAVSTPDWNPRSSAPVSDPDGDGIPGKDDLGQQGEQLLAGSGCDPTPITDTGAGDHDGDGFLNRQDNCALVANATQLDSDGDGIGDACDTVVTQPDGHLHEVCVTSTVTVGLGGTPTTPACPEFVPDMDNDGFDRTTEEHVGTDPADPCGTNAWPADLNSTGISTNRIDILDAGSFIAPVRRIDTSPGNPDYDVRWDLYPGSTFGSTINIQDIAVLVTLYPPMLEGPRAFGGPSCPYAP